VSSLLSSVPITLLYAALSTTSTIPSKPRPSSTRINQDEKIKPTVKHVLDEVSRELDVCGLEVIEPSSLPHLLGHDDSRSTEDPLLGRTLLLEGAHTLDEAMQESSTFVPLLEDDPRRTEESQFAGCRHDPPLCWSICLDEDVVLGSQRLIEELI